LESTEVEATACMGEQLGASEMLREDSGQTRGTKALELVLAKGWNERVLHFDDSETGEGIMKV